MTDVARDPREVRDEMVVDYTRSVRQRGAEPDVRDIERIVAADLATYEAVEREKRHAPAPKPAEPDAREDTAAIAARDQGIDLYRAAPKDKPGTLLDAHPFAMGEKFAFMMGRVRRILEMPPGLRAKNMTEMVNACAYPKLARKFVSVWVFYNAPSMPHPANPFLDLNRADRARKWIRLVEDICDESSGVLGPWWVPK